MYSGFVTHKHSIKRLGVHQRLDAAAYRMVRGYFGAGEFPPIKQITHFEGRNGPDALKFKPSTYDGPNHFFDPRTGQGDLPMSIERHFKGLVRALHAGDRVRAAFEASWLAHFVVDGLTPAHHVLPDDEFENALGGQIPVKAGIKGLASGPGALRKNWTTWVEKKIIPTHHNFEIGIATTIIGRPIRVKLDPVKLAHARKDGYMKFFKEEAGDIAKLDLYTEFRKKGWTSSIAASIRHQVNPAAVQAVGIIWLLAYLEAGLKDVKQVALAAAV